MHNCYFYFIQQKTSTKKKKKTINSFETFVESGEVADRGASESKQAAVRAATTATATANGDDATATSCAGDRRDQFGVVRRRRVGGARNDRLVGRQLRIVAQRDRLLTAATRFRNTKLTQERTLSAKYNLHTQTEKPVSVPLESLRLRQIRRLRDPNR